ncbi:DUF6291 domain-containing protein [Pumilibacter intestinalis]|uniref:DUF6291 domain-containing protein n=1 Tax=Pumilibacter intestinalis TaxID=2941511 RepID=UPI00203FCC07|nr:DUF6291 domain-containing protein [Pumilibacter intestinalis]
MKNINIKREHYDMLKELTDKQAGEFVKGVCAYAFEGKPFLTKDRYLKGLFMYAKRALDVSEMNSVNGKKGADKLAENKRRNKTVGVLVGSVIMPRAIKKENADGE